jgi:ring-1,2-phenylacetyl-CoA epoxidase subunit PaaE
MKKYTLKVQDIRQETADTITLCFKQPGLKKIKYLAGQYLTLSFRINGRRYSRPYSFSSSPAVDGFLETTIKRVPNGIFSNYVNDTVQVGDVVEVLEPMGDFVYTHEESTKVLYLWGVGSGVTPLFSILKEVLVVEPLLQIRLMYGNKNVASTIFQESLENLLTKYSDRLQVWHFHTQSETSTSNSFVKRGRINAEFIINLLQDVDIANTKHYICGPVGMKNTIKTVLNSLQCPEDLIFSEDFELVKDPKDFEAITTQPVTIHFENVTTTLTVEKGKSVLEAALDAGLELPYSCQTGSCDTCKATLKSGNLRMIGLTKERDDLGTNEFLLCCSYPLSEGVVVEV